MISILYCYITVKGALRQMQKFPHHNNMIIETKKAYKGDLLCCNEWIHHVTHSSFGVLSAGEYFSTEVIRLNQNGFLMIQKDETAFNKLRIIVSSDLALSLGKRHVDHVDESGEPRPLLVHLAQRITLIGVELTEGRSHA